MELKNMSYTLKLKDAFKKSTLDQDKIISPEETVKRFKEKLKKVNLDILESTARIDNGRLDIPVFFSICGRDAANIIGTKKQMGKGGTTQQAEASAVMELTERFSFFSFASNPENFIIQTYDSVKGDSIPFEMIAQSVHDNSEELLRAEKVFETLPMRWTWGYNLTGEKSVLIPFDWFFAINEFNGPSAGNCTEEALSQGICEIVERHVSSIISQKRLSVPGLLTDNVTDPLVTDMLKKYQNAGIRLFISDFTLDMGIPSVGVMAYDPSTFPEKSEIVWTAGTTPDPQKSLSRALSETAQLSGDFNTGSNYVASGLPKFTHIEQASFITHPDNHISISVLPDLSNDNIKLEVQNLISALRRKNMEVLAINTMHQDLQIPAFYTIIPGAHFRERALGTSVGMFTAKLIAEKLPPEQALTRLNHAEQFLPNKYYIQFYIGNCLLAMNEPQKALSHFDRAMELNPTPEDIPSIYSYMGVCLKDLQEYRQALKVLEKGLVADPDRTDIYNLMGFCHFKLKEHEAAINCFENILRLNPSSAIDYANIGSNYRDMGEYDKAVHYYKIALELNPSIEFARQNLENLGEK
jgi:ribosomal protein S12 methylthiotransferase accessory factor